MDELAAFPGGSKDDQVDAFSRAFAMLIPADEPARFASIPYLMR
jgi:phage terminase large subunit-like protein